MTHQISHENCTSVCYSKKKEEKIEQPKENKVVGEEWRRLEKQNTFAKICFGPTTKIVFERNTKIISRR